MNTTQLYYTRILDTFIEEYEDQLTQVKEGHCMKVVGLPLDVLESLYDRLKALNLSLQIFILSENNEGDRYISATKLIELRNDLTLSILVLIPVNVSTAAEDSYGNATFKELSIAHLNQRLLNKLMSEVQSNDIIREILGFTKEGFSQQKILDYLLYVIENGQSKEAIGKGLFILGLLPDADIAKDSTLVRRRLSINNESVTQMVDYSKQINDRIDALPLLPNTLQRELAMFLQMEKKANSRTELCEAVANHYTDIDFSKWNDCIKGIDVTSLGNLTVSAVELYSKSFGNDLEGDLTLPIQSNKPAKIKIRVFFSPKPKAFPDLKKVRIAIYNVDGMYCEYDRLKTANVTDNARDYRDITVTIKPNDFNSGRYFFRVFAEDENGTVLNQKDGFKDDAWLDKWNEVKEQMSKEEFIERNRAFLTSDSETFFLQTVDASDFDEDLLQDSRREKISNVLQAYFHYRNSLSPSARRSAIKMTSQRLRIKAGRRACIQIPSVSSILPRKTSKSSFPRNCWKLSVKSLRRVLLLARLRRN